MTTLNESYVNSIKINRATKTQLEQATGLSPNQLYLEDPEFAGGKLLESTSDGNIVESSQTIPTKTSDLTNDSGFITSSALTGYATETWVGQQGFLTSTALNGYATQQWVGQQGYITGITSSDVTTALGYSPVNPSSLASVATSGSYNDLSNKPTIPAAQVNSDWNANSGVAQILNKPTLATVATTGAYSDLTGKPTIPTVNNPTITITQGGVTKGSFTLNQSSGDTIAIDAGGGSSLPSQTGNAGKFLTTDGTDASWGVPSSFKLFHYDWFDYQLNDQSWLRADTFSWQDGTVYSNAYNHLVADYQGGTSQTETVGSYTITYVLATDGHKITTDETNVANIYNESGVAWYYVLDTTNQKFKLPRTKYGFTGLRDIVGKYVPESLPNLTGTVAWNNGDQGHTELGTADGVFAKIANTSKTYPSTGGTTSAARGFTIDASRSSSAYQDNAPVQQRATQMYLYFYVGQFSQSATEQTAGLNAELFNNKADTDMGNISATGISNIRNAANYNLDYASRIDFSFPTSGNKYTAPCDGIYFCCFNYNANSTVYLNINGEQVATRGTHNNYREDQSIMTIPLSRGDIVYWQAYTNVYTNTFIPYKNV